MPYGTKESWERLGASWEGLTDCCEGPRLDGAQSWPGGPHFQLGGLEPAVRAPELAERALE